MVALLHGSAAGRSQPPACTFMRGERTPAAQASACGSARRQQWPPRSSAGLRSVEFRRTLVASAFGGSSNLSFHSLWQPVREKLLEGDIEGADQAYKKLTVQVAASPDLTEADRLGTLTTYRTQAEQWRKAATEVGALKRAGEADIITRLVDVADNPGMPRAVADLLKSTSALINSQRNRDVSAEAALGTDALVSTASLVRKALDDGMPNTSPEDLAHTSAHLVSATLSTPLQA
jgi:hypothetical protein